MKISSSQLFAVILASLLLTNCAGSGNRGLESAEQFRPPSLRTTSISAETMAKWSRSCALCHITGEAGAPLVGDTAEWQRRLQQGEDAILNNVLEGVNSMPPLGYCMSCEISDFRAMIVYMAGLNQ